MTTAVNAEENAEANQYEPVLARVSRSKFRSSFKLSDADLAYARSKGRVCVERHAQDFVLGRLAPAQLKNDGKQTPMKGHPVFKAMHACACCCRGCLEKWHHIPQGQALSSEDQGWIVALLMAWIDRQMDAAAVKSAMRSPALEVLRASSAECEGQTYLSL